MKSSGLKKDRLLRKCELLMAKGVDSISDISEQLGISYNTARSYQEIVKERWADSYTIEELQVKRKRLIKQAEAVIAESWELKDKAKNVQDATNALRMALAAVERLQKLHGIDAVPPQPEKPKELQISELANRLNTFLAPEAKQLVLSAIKKAISMKKQSNLIQ